MKHLLCPCRDGSPFSDEMAEVATVKVATFNGCNGCKAKGELSLRSSVGTRVTRVKDFDVKSKTEEGALSLRNGTVPQEHMRRNCNGNLP